jgi:hypothetical protein
VVLEEVHAHQENAMSITRKTATSLTVLAALMGVGLAGCVSLDLTSPKQQAELAKTETGLFQSRDFDAVKAQLIPKLRDSDFQALQALDETIALGLVGKAFARARPDE